MVCEENRIPKVIHVAGTNGKGSVCAYLREILVESGFSVGLFTSPHLESIRERICIDQTLISEEDFVRIFLQVKDAITCVKNQMGHPSFFEFLFLMAMVYFSEHEVSYCILETGLGGRLDATNVIKQPCVCVITSIGYDHMEYLGNTLEEIAEEKAGIMKANVPVVFSDQEDKIKQVLSNKAKKTGSIVTIIKKTDILNVNISNKSIDFSFHSGYYKYISLSLATKALYQVENATLAITAAALLKEDKITPGKIRVALLNTSWPGRMEETEEGVYIDGAHNLEGMKAFLESVSRDGCRGRRYLLFGVVSDKQYDKMIELLGQTVLFEQIAVAQIESSRSVSLEQLKEEFIKFQELDCVYFERAQEAYKYLNAYKRGDDLVYIAGSLYLAGQIKSFMKENT